MSFYRENFISRLKSFISDYEYEVREMEAMKERWEEYDDPGSDPGLQYEQEMKIENAFNHIIEHVKTHKYPYKKI